MVQRFTIFLLLLMSFSGMLLADTIKKDFKSTLFYTSNSYNTVTLKGVVENSNGELLEGATIRLVYGGTQNEIVNEVIVNGSFEVTFERSGSYHLFIKKDGFRSAATPLVDEYLEGLELKVILGKRESSIQSNKSTFNNAMQMYDRVSDREQQMMGRLMAFYNKDEGKVFDPIDYSFEIRKQEKEIQSILKNTRESEELKIKVLEYLSFKGIQTKVKIKAQIFKGEISPEIAKIALETIEPGSNLWYLYPESFYAALLTLPDQLQKMAEYANKMIEESVSEYTVSECLFFLLKTSEKQGNEAVFNEFLGKLLSFYPTSAASFKAKSDFDLPSSLSIGETVPPFSLQNMDDNTIRITEQLLLGKYYLMDFWSTSCGGCIQAMPDHTEMYEKYKDKNFTILSISLDQRKERVKEFRDKRYPMPWINSFTEEGFNSKVARDFEVGWLPRLYLISPEGRIIAKDDELRGVNLDKTLQNFLN